MLFETYCRLKCELKKQQVLTALLRNKTKALEEGEAKDEPNNRHDAHRSVGLGHHRIHALLTAEPSVEESKPGRHELHEGHTDEEEACVRGVDVG